MRTGPTTPVNLSNPFARKVSAPPPPAEPKRGHGLKSRLGNLTVADIRFLFMQMRNCENLNVDTTLWIGMSAGEFTHAYLMMSSSMQQKGDVRP